MEITYNLNEVDAVAEKLLKNLSSKIILLYGDMGVGKTTLVKSIVKHLGSDSDVSSPTFSIVNEYTSKSGLIYHFDLYRINNIEETLDFGIEDYLYTEHWVIIEWPELIAELLPDRYNTINIDVYSEGNRVLNLH